jgi:hypothetical protein
MSETKLYPPYPSSKVIKGVTFDWASRRRLAPGSDNWPLTWADDGHQYTSFGDGGGFGGTNAIGRVSMGVARVEGDRQDYRGYNVWGGKDAENPATFPGKSWGIICIDGIFYMWRSGEASADCYESQRLYQSDDHGATWTFTGVEFDNESFRRSRGFFVPTFLQYGQDYQDARDEYVYMYAPEVKSLVWELQVPGEINLIRVPKHRITSREHYEFYAGSSESGPKWTTDGDRRKPVFYDANGTMRVNAVYNPGLKKVILTAQHTARNYGWGIYEANEPWGAWRTIYYSDCLVPSDWECKKISYVSFSPKWWDNDGWDFVMIFSGREYNDAWNSVEGSFILHGLS